METEIMLGSGVAELMAGRGPLATRGDPELEIRGDEYVEEMAGRDLFVY
ncbi:hypothetical protein IMZ48_15630 [Candidatus Bathyarchaeota archaeon]|nr:hypothetical protein [Candidatus Bathyarchaeota archaeon]